MIKLKNIIAVLTVACLVCATSFTSFANYAIDEPGNSDEFKEYQNQTYTGKGETDSPFIHLSSQQLTALSSQQKTGYALIAYFNLIPNATLTPTGYITRSEALAFLYNAFAEQSEIETANTAAKELREKGKFNSFDIWADGYYYMALQNGLITEEDFKLAFHYDSAFSMQYQKNGYISKENLLVWLAKLLQLEPSSEIFALKFYTDFGFIAPANRAYINAVLEKDLFFEIKSRTLCLSSNTTFGDMFYLTDKLKDILPDLDNLHCVTGTVTDVSESGMKIKFNSDEITYDIINVTDKANFPLVGLTEQKFGNNLNNGDFASLYINHDNNVEYGVVYFNGSFEQNIFYSACTLRGNLYFYDVYSNSAVLTDAEIYRYGKWEHISSESKYYTVALTDDVVIYDSGKYYLPYQLNSDWTDAKILLTCGYFNSYPTMLVRAIKKYT